VAVSYLQADTVQILFLPLDVSVALPFYVSVLGSSTGVFCMGGRSPFPAIYTLPTSMLCDGVRVMLALSLPSEGDLLD